MAAASGGQKRQVRVGVYNIDHMIGSGSFAKVFRGQHRVTRQVVAVKAISRARLNKKLMENLESEISILKSLEHPNIVCLHDIQVSAAPSRARLPSFRVRVAKGPECVVARGRISSGLKLACASGPRLRSVMGLGTRCHGRGSPLDPCQPLSFLDGAVLPGAA